MRITGSKESLAALLKKAYVPAVGDEDENKFSFQALYPCPEELMKSGISTFIGTYEKESAQRIQWRKDQAKDNPPGHWASFSEEKFQEALDKLKEECERAVRNKVDFGAVSWYDWKVNNWGTKWEPDVEVFSLDKPTQASGFFQSAWAPPIDFFEKVSKDYPDLEFVLHYCEPGMGFCGTWTSEQGDKESYFPSRKGETCQVHGNHDEWIDDEEETEAV